MESLRSVTLESDECSSVVSTVGKILGWMICVEFFKLKVPQNENVDNPLRTASLIHRMPNMPSLHRPCSSLVVIPVSVRTLQPPFGGKWSTFLFTIAEFNVRQIHFKRNVRKPHCGAFIQICRRNVITRNRLGLYWAHMALKKSLRHIVTEYLVNKNATIMGCSRGYC